MTALKVLAVILIVLFLLSLIRLGGIAEYSQEGFLAWVRVGTFRIKVFPLKEKPKKKEKTKKEPEKTGGEPEKKPKGGSLELLKGVLPLVGEAAGALKRRIRVDRLYLDLVTAGPDPARAAMTFGYANAAIGMIWPVFEQNFEVRDHRFRTAVDFQAANPTVYLNAAFSARLGQLVSFAVIFGVKLLKVYLRGRKPATSKKEAI